MKYAEFASALARNPNDELVFEFGGMAIRRGYHLTEVLRLTVDAIDCGGAMDRWTETVLQLVEAAPGASERVMSAAKAAGILQRSHEQIPLPAQSEVVLEFRAEAMAAAQRFHVSSVLPSADGQLRVVTVGTGTQCKAAQRSQSVCGVPKAASACCAPSPSASPTPANAVCCAAEPNAATVPSGQAARCCA